MVMGPVFLSIHGISLECFFSYMKYRVVRLSATCQQDLSLDHYGGAKNLYLKECDNCQCDMLKKSVCHWF